MLTLIPMHSSLGFVYCVYCGGGNDQRDKTTVCPELALCWVQVGSSPSSTRAEGTYLEIFRQIQQYLGKHLGHPHKGGNWLLYEGRATSCSMQLQPSGPWFVFPPGSLTQNLWPSSGASQLILIGSPYFAISPPPCLMLWFFSLCMMLNPSWFS